MVQNTPEVALFATPKLSEKVLRKGGNCPEKWEISSKKKYCLEHLNAANSNFANKMRRISIVEKTQSGKQLV